MLLLLQSREMHPTETFAKGHGLTKDTCIGLLHQMNPNGVRSPRRVLPGTTEAARLGRLVWIRLCIAGRLSYFAPGDKCEVGTRTRERHQ
jgi:hypothetical protein